MQRGEGASGQTCPCLLPLQRTNDEPAARTCARGHSCPITRTRKSYRGHDAGAQFEAGAWLLCGAEALELDAVLADQREEGAPVLLGAHRGVGDVALVACEEMLDVAALKLLDDVRLRGPERAVGGRIVDAGDVDVGGGQRRSFG